VRSVVTPRERARAASEGPPADTSKAAGCVRRGVFAVGVALACAIGVSINGPASVRTDFVVGLLVGGGVLITAVLGRVLRGVFIAGVAIAVIILAYVVVFNVLVGVFIVFMAVLMSRGGVLIGVLIGGVCGGYLGIGLTRASDLALIACVLIGATFGALEGAFIGAISRTAAGGTRGRPRPG